MCSVPTQTRHTHTHTHAHTHTHTNTHTHTVCLSVSLCLCLFLSLSLSVCLSVSFVICLLANYVIIFIFGCFPQTCETREVTHYQYTEWAEHAIPLVHDLLEFIWRVKAASTDLRGPLLVHCRYTSLHLVISQGCAAAMLQTEAKPETDQTGK